MLLTLYKEIGRNLGKEKCLAELKYDSADVGKNKKAGLRSKRVFQNSLIKKISKSWDFKIDFCFWNKVIQIFLAWNLYLITAN